MSQNQESGNVVLMVDVKDTEPRSALFVNGNFGGIEIDEDNAPLAHIFQRLGDTMGEALSNFNEGQIRVEVTVTKPAPATPIKQVSPRT